MGYYTLCLELEVILSDVLEPFAKNIFYTREEIQITFETHLEEVLDMEMHFFSQPC